MKASPAVLLLGAFLLILIDSAITKYAKWHRLKNQAVSEYSASTSARSGIMCVGECMKHSQCDSCAYDMESGTCYLQVETDPTTDASVASVDVFTAIMPCDPSRDLLNISGTKISWRKKGWTTDGDVICNDDYMYIGDSPTFRCSAVGQWTVNPWECRQRIWRNPKTETRLDVPKPPEAEWAVCMNGTPTQHTRFTINFEQTERDIPVLVDFRLQYGYSVNTVVVVSKVDGTWAEEVRHNHMSPFPVAVNQICQVVVKAVSLFDVQIFVDGAYIGNYTTPISMDKVATVLAKRDVDVHMLDLWCSQ